MNSISRSLKANDGAGRRKLLTVGGLAAALGVAAPTRPVHAAHDDEDIGIGLDNPTNAVSPPTTTTNLRTNVSGIGFRVQQDDGVAGTAIRGDGSTGDGSLLANGGHGIQGFGGNAAGTSSGGSGVLGNGGNLGSGTPSSSRYAGTGLSAEGGGGFDLGNGGAGVFAQGGNIDATGPQFAAPGDGVIGQGGSNAVSNSAIGGTGVSGVGGTSANVTTTGIGVLGTSGSNSGVQGNSQSGAGVSGVSVQGIGTRGESGQSHGVFGESFNDAGAGVRGAHTTGVAVDGANDSNSVAAVRGINSGSRWGVFGQSSSGVGIRGVSFGATTAGVEGVASAGGPGVWGFTSSGHAVLGNSTTGNGGVFASSSGYALSAQTTTGAVGLFVKGNTFSVQAQGNLTCTGSGHFNGGIVIATRMADGSLRGTAAVTSPDSLVEDVGRARLVNGSARVELDRQFASLINTADYAVFPVPRGDCKGLYLASQSATGFEIRELQAGSSSIDFDYRIVAKRTGTAALARFAKVDEPPPPPTFPAMPELPKPESATRTERSPSVHRPSTQPTRSTGGSSIGTPSAGTPRPRR